MAAKLIVEVTFATCAQSLWTDLKERFDGIDGSRTFSLPKEITTLQLGTDFVATYYTKLKNLPSPACNYDRSRGFVEHLNRQKVYQFLIMGLNDSYSGKESNLDDESYSGNKSDIINE